MADAELLVDGDLDMIDMIAIPDRLEHAIGEAQHQDVLNRFFAEVMIDPIDLVLIDDFQQFGIQGLCRSKVGPERFFNHQPPPPAAILLQQTGAAEFAADRQKRIRRRRQIEQPIAAGRPVRFEFFGSLPQSIERGRIPRIGFYAGDAFEQAFGDGIVHRTGCELAQALHQAVAKCVVRRALAGDADHAEFVGQQIGRGKIIKGRDDQPVGKVAGDAEDDERAGIRLPLI